MKRILIVNVNWLGDVLFSTAAIRALRKKYPDSFLACLVPPRCEGILRNNPYLNEVIVFKDRRHFWAPFDFLKTVFLLKRKRFDTALFFHRSKTKTVLAFLGGIPERIGYAAGSRDLFLTHVYPRPQDRLHRTELFLNLLHAAGVPSDGRSPDFFPSKEAPSELESLFKKHGFSQEAPYVVVHAGGNWDLKRWPAAYFVEWIKRMRRDFPYKIILCGAGREKRISEEIKSHFEEGSVVSFCGETSLDALALLLKGAQLLLSNDSGPIHLAASQKTRIVGVFGPTSADETGPLSQAPAVILRKDVGCEIPCYFRACNYRICMEWLKPEDVFEKTKELLIGNS